MVAVEVVAVIVVEVVIVVDTMEYRISSIIVGASTAAPVNSLDFGLSRLSITVGGGSSSIISSGTIFVSVMVHVMVVVMCVFASSCLFVLLVVTVRTPQKDSFYPDPLSPSYF